MITCKKHIGSVMIYFTLPTTVIDTMTKDPDAATRFIDGLKTDSNLTETVLDWLIKQARGRLIEQDILNSILDPAKTVQLQELEKYLDEMTAGTEWQTKIRIYDYFDFVRLALSAQEFFAGSQNYFSD